MKEENERIVTEKQVPEIDDKVVQCKSNIKQAVEELKRKTPRKVDSYHNKAWANFSWGQRENENLKKFPKNCKRRKVIVWQRKINDCSF